MLFAALASGLVAGLVAVPHCTLMCGPLCAYACRGKDLGAPARYQLGRMTSYTILGVLAGSLGAGIAALSGSWGSAFFSWSLAIALVVAAIALWRGASTRSTDTSLVTVGRKKPSLATRVLARVPNHALLLGAASALLPCGALAVAVLLAAGSGTALDGAAVMLGFSLTSGAGVLVAGALASRVRRISNPRRRRVLAGALLIGAAILIARPIPALTHENHSEPAMHDCPLHSITEAGGDHRGA
jgi:sulfite exporter TauE/SafE